MKICIISSYYLPTLNAASVRINSLVKTWEKNDIDIVLLTGKKNKLNIKNKYNEKIKIKRAFIKILDNKYNFIHRLVNEIIFTFWCFFRVLFIKKDICFVSSPLFFPLLAIYFVSKITRKKYYIDIRDVYPDVVFESGLISKTSLIGQILIYLERKIYDGSEKIFTVTESLVRIISKRTNTPVILARNGINANDFYNMRIKKYKKFTIMFHGILAKYQNIKFIISYAKFLKNQNVQDIKILIYGDGCKKNYLLSEVEENNLGDIIYYKGFKDLKEVNKQINKSHLGISLRIDGEISKNSFPVKVYEYLACGVPVIVSPVSEAGNYLEKKKAGYQVKNNDILALHQYVLKFKNNKKLYLDFSKRSEKLVFDFNREQIAKSVLESICKF